MKTSSALAIMAITITGIVGTVVVIASGHDPSGLFGLFSSIITGVMVLYKVDRVDNTIDRVDHNVNGHLSKLTEQAFNNALVDPKSDLPDNQDEA
jgi:hypothetical protein